MFRRFHQVLMFSALLAGCQHAPMQMAGGQQRLACVSPVPPVVNPNGVAAVEKNASAMASAPAAALVVLPGAVVSVYVPMRYDVVAAVAQNQRPAPVSPVDAPARESVPAAKEAVEWVKPQQPVAAAPSQEPNPPKAQPQAADPIVTVSNTEVPGEPVRAILEFDGTSDVAPLVQAKAATPAAAPSCTEQDKSAKAKEAEMDKLLSHAPDYSWLVGRLQYVHADKSWHVRYAPINSEDPHGGNVSLDVSDRSMQEFESGQMVLVQGGMITSEKKSGNSYRVRVIQNLSVAPK